MFRNYRHQLALPLVTRIMDFWELFRGMEIVWILWFSSVALLGFLTWHLLIRLVRLDYRAVFARLCPRRIHNDTNGAAYSLSFIMVLPFLVLSIALVMETTFMLVAKIGTMHAAFAAARTASVWTTRDARFQTSDDDFLLARAKAQQAAVTAMVPYSSSFDLNEISDAIEKLRIMVDSFGKNIGNLLNSVENLNFADIDNLPATIGELFGNITKIKDDIKKLGEAITNLRDAMANFRDGMQYLPDAMKYWAIYEFYNLPRPEKKPNLQWLYLIRKCIYAAQNVKAELELTSANRSDPKWKKHVEAKVAYDYPFKFMPFGLLLGKKVRGNYVYEIASTAQINNECPRNNRGEIRIRINKPTL